MKKLALIALAFVALEASAQQDTLKYRISLKDKAATTYSLKHPEKFLSERRLPAANVNSCPSIRLICRYAVSMWMPSATRE